MKSPSFWYRPSWLSWLLWPFSLCYLACFKFRWYFSQPSRVDVPVICVGNIVMGGAGKTPCVIAICQFLIQHGKKPHVISRGYKGSFSGCVDLTQHSFKDVGDEGILLARIAPTWVGKDRVKNAHHAISCGATHLILDDGFQNPFLFKNFSILIEDKIQKRGNNFIFPAGPLREPFHSARKRAQYVWVPNLSMKGPKTEAPLVAFAGIGYPDKFFSSLSEKGFQVIESLSYPDHYAYTEKDILFLKSKASFHHAVLATTAKDAVRLSHVKDFSLLIFDVEVSLPEEIVRALYAL